MAAKLSVAAGRFFGLKVENVFGVTVTLTWYISGAKVQTVGVAGQISRIVFVHWRIFFLDE